MPESFTITNYFEQQRAAGEMMAKLDEKMTRLIEELEAEGNTLVSISYDY